MDEGVGLKGGGWMWDVDGWGEGGLYICWLEDEGGWWVDVDGIDGDRSGDGDGV